MCLIQVYSKMTQALENYYNFTAHNVFTLPTDADKVFAAPDKLLVTSLTKMIIRVHDLGSKGSITHELETRGVVRWAEYCVVNNHIATIEDDTVYVYQMWWSSEQKVNSLGCADCAAWCHSSGQLVISNGETVTVYEDLRQLYKLDGLCGRIEDVAFCENILAVRTPTHVLVINLHEDTYTTADGEIIWNFDQESLIINTDSLASPPKMEKPRLQSETPTHLKEMYLPDRPIYGLNINMSNIRNDSICQPKVVLMKKSQPSFMSLVAYHSCAEQSAADPLTPPPRRLDYVNLLLADSSYCELFCVYGGRGRGRVNFTGCVHSVAVDECFMHVLKSDSLDTFALPLPDLSSDWEPHHLSTHRMSMKHLLMARDYLIVLSSRQMDDITVYSLLKPTTSEFFADISASAEKAALERAKDIVRLQCRTYGKNCSQRLLAVYNDIEKNKSLLTLDDVLEGPETKAQTFKEIIARTDQSLILKDGFLTDLGERVLSLHPDAFEVILAKNDKISPKVLRAQMAKATPQMAVLITRHVCSHLDRIEESSKIHRKLLQTNVPSWIYELQPFNGAAPDPQCSSCSNCKCLRCTGRLLYAAVVLSSAPMSVRLTSVFGALPKDAPDILRLACLLPLTKTSAASPAHYVSVVNDIIATVRPYTHKAQVTAPHLLTVLSDVLTLSDFLRCVPEGCPAIVPWLRNGLMRQRAQILKEEIVHLGEELRQLIP